MNEPASFKSRNKSMINKMTLDKDLKEISKQWLLNSYKYEYSYHFTWLGRPIIQYPQDIIAIQEIIWKVKPDLIIETGIAHGGSLIFSASLLELLGKGKVIGIDIDIREHNRKEIENHSLSKRIEMIEGSSIDEKIISKVEAIVKEDDKILVILDSNHTHEHVLKELELYSKFVKNDSYLIVLDTIIEDMEEDSFSDRPWNKKNNPKTAVWEFLKNNDRFKIDKQIQNKLVITVAPDGYLKCIKD